MRTLKSEGYIDPTNTEENTTGEKSLSEKAKDIAGKSYEMAGKVLDMNSHANWVGEKWEKFKNVSKEWAKDVFDTVKMKTIDKWKFMREKEETNTLITHKVNDIADLKGRAETEAYNITIFENNKSADDANFAPTLDSARDPVIREIFKRTWDEKTAKSEADILNSQRIIENIDRVTMHYAREIVRFQESTTEAGAIFGERIDNRIEKIREKYGYYECQDQLGREKRKIEIGEGYVRNFDEKINEYTSALNQAYELGVSEADCKILEDGIAQFNSRRNSTIKVVEKLRKVSYKLHIKIHNIDSKTYKYEEMKRKMGIEVESTGSVEENPESPSEDVDNLGGVINEDFGGEAETSNEHQGQEQDIQGLSEEGGQNENEDEKPLEEISQDSVPVDVAEDSITETEQTLSDAKVESPVAEIVSTPEVESVTPVVLGENVADNVEESTGEEIEEPEESSDIESENIEAQQESVNEAVSKSLNQLYKLISEKSNSKLHAIEILDKTLAFGKILAEYEDVFTKDEDERLSKGFKEIQETYDRRNLGMMTPEARESIKKDVLNKIIRRLPDWISL